MNILYISVNIILKTSKLFYGVLILILQKSLLSCLLNLYQFSVTGGCTCQPGFTGPKCQSICDPGWYGKECLQRCNCIEDHTESCDPADGSSSSLSGYKVAF